MNFDDYAGIILIDKKICFAPLSDPVTYEVTLMFELMDMSLYDLIKGRKG